MTVISLFDGMSVAQQAIKELKLPITSYYASEIDPYAIAVTQSNHPKTIKIGSVIDLNSSQFKNIELLVGGSPCQDLSIAKKDRQGLKGLRSGLFYEYVRILNEVKPRYFILENVNSMPKEAKEQISEILGVKPVMINASLVSAQNRKRLFWVGELQSNGIYKQVEIPQPKDKEIFLKDILDKEVGEKYYVLDKHFQEKIKSNTIRTPARCSGLGDKHNWDTIRVGSINSGGQGDRIYSQEGKSIALSANGGGSGAKTGLYAIKSNYNGSLRYDKANTLGTNSQCQTAKTGQAIVDFKNCVIRKLTPTECLKLQSMPDDYFDKAEYKGKPVSNTQRYKMCGNAFNCEVIKHIISFLELE